MVQDVRKKYHIERLIGEGDVRSIEHFDRDVSVVAEQHIDATDGEIGPPGLKNSGDKAIAAADVEHAGGGRSKLGKPSGDGFDSAVEDQLLVQDSDGAHGICSVQRDAGEKARQTRDLCAVCRKKRDPLARFTCSGRLLVFAKDARSQDDNRQDDNEADSIAIGNQRNEADRVAERDHGLAVHHANELELLGLEGADGDDHASAFAELREQSGGNIESGSGDKDGVEGSVSGETKCTVAGEHVDIGITHRGKNGARVGSEGTVAFDGEYLRGEFCEKSGDVSGTGADFEDGVGRDELKQFEHDGDNVGLGNSLIVADGERMVIVGLGAEGPGDEFVAGNAKHGVEDARVGDAAGAELRVDH